MALVVVVAVAAGAGAGAGGAGGRVGVVSDVFASTCVRVFVLLFARELRPSVTFLCVFWETLPSGSMLVRACDHRQAEQFS